MVDSDDDGGGGRYVTSSMQQSAFVISQQMAMTVKYARKQTQKMCSFKHIHTHTLTRAHIYYTAIP